MTLNEFLTGIADAIRAKKGTTGTIKATDFASEIASISTGSGGSNQKLVQLVNGTVTELTAEDLAGVTGIRDYLFKHTALESIVIPDSATYIGEEAFYGSNLVSVVIGNGVTSIDMSAFDSCTDLESVVIGNSVQDIDSYAFYYCSSLTSVVIPDSVTSIGTDVFYSCSSLESVVMGNSVADIGDGAFYDCSELKRVDFSRHTFVPSIELNWDDEWPFEGCHEDLEIKVPANLFEQWRSATNWSDYAYYIVKEWGEREEPEEPEVDGSQGLAYELAEDSYEYDWYDGYVVTGMGSCTDMDIVIPSTYRGQPVTVIGAQAFYEEYIDSVVIPDSVELIGEGAFYDSTLDSVVMGYGVREIGMEAFADCDALTDVTLGSSVHTIGESAFMFCSSLESIVMPDTVDNIGDNAFDSCSKLKRVDFSAHEDNGFVPTLGEDVFYGCHNKLQIKVPASLYDEWIEATNWSDYDDRIVTEFTNEYSQGLDIDEWGSLNGIGTCTDTDIIIPPTHNGVAVTSIESYAFELDDDIETVIIPDTVEDIWDYAFSACDSLTSVTMGSSVSYIGEEAFSWSDSLKRVDFSKHTFIPYLSTDVFLFGSSRLQIKVPANLIDEWKAKTNWSEWADYIVTEFTN